VRPEQVLERLGGVADAATLLTHVTRPALRAATANGLVIRLERGRYALPGADEALACAHRLSGLLCEDSAAQLYGWPLKHRPSSPVVVVPRKRNLPEHRRRGVRVRFVDLPAEDVNRVATGPVRTVLDCAARMPFDEALAVADSALRSLDVSSEHLLRRAEAAPARHRARCVRVARAADARAANPFESVLRAIALTVPGLAVVPQVWLGDIGRPDLVDERLRIVLEADSFEFHGRRKALADDCERYNAFVVDGWIVLRFAWEHVMFRPDYVRAVLVGAVEQALARSRRPGAA
jgi:very-short-patch-repair endonuclease